MASCSEILMAMVDRDHHGRTVTSHGRDFSTPRFGPFFKTRFKGNAVVSSISCLMLYAHRPLTTYCNVP